MPGVISLGQSAGYSPTSQHLSRLPECSSAARWFLQWINISCTIFVCFILTSLKSHQDWLVSCHSCHQANQMKGGSSQGTLMCAASVELLRSDLKIFAFINNFCLQCEFQISFFICSVLYINITDLKAPRPKTGLVMSCSCLILRTQSKIIVFSSFSNIPGSSNSYLVTKKKRKKLKKVSWIKVAYNTSAEGVACGKTVGHKRCFKACSGVSLKRISFYSFKFIDILGSFPLCCLVYFV